MRIFAHGARQVRMFPRPFSEKMAETKIPCRALSSLLCSPLFHHHHVHSQDTIPSSAILRYFFSLLRAPGTNVLFESPGPPVAGKGMSGREDLLDNIVCLAEEE